MYRLKKNKNRKGQSLVEAVVILAVVTAVVLQVAGLMAQHYGTATTTVAAEMPDLADQIATELNP